MTDFKSLKALRKQRETPASFVSRVPNHNGIAGEPSRENGDQNGPGSKTGASIEGPMDSDRDKREEQKQEAQKSAQVVERTLSGPESLQTPQEQQAGPASASFVSKATHVMAGEPSRGNDEQIEPSGTRSSAEASMDVDVVEENKAEESQKLAQVSEPSASTSSKQDYEGLYKALPLSLEISTTKESGRGLYSSVLYKPDRTSLPKDPDPFNTEVHTHLAHGVVGYLGLTSPQQLEPYGIHSAADLVDLVSRFTTNTFTVTTPTLSPLGACVAPSVALINHSCDPNAAVVFPRAGGDADKANEPLLQVIALKYIQPGDEVLTSYIDTTLPRELRLKTLKETYHFTLKDTDAVLDALRIGQEALDKAERVQDIDPRKAFQLTENLSQILMSAGLVPSAHPLLALSRLHTSLLITKLSTDPESNIEEVFSPQIQEQSSSPSNNSSRHGPEEAQKALDDAIRSATRANTGLSQVLTFGHPARGVSVAELGKLLTVDEPVPKDVQDGGDIFNTTTPMPPPNSPSYPPSGPNRLKLAHETLVRARSELLVGFGNSNEGGEVGKQIRKQIVDVEKELSVWRTGIRNAMKTASSKKPIQ
ncbi:hypothetical protein EST38_g8886 [Candolleomyces aberdarensis]|uniref:SET domain-containing protein n=1 Tax=Candolleomyces aberdarensis TaxID=2316362 RepID=A0A4V1Q311_9AGAR|nr:hypothetical protein EST38_g8886 [Candolleomyces aberdarensis]